ncbi:MAG: YkgJ family cysteine cluster protein [Bdellovibrionales bacterium]|nr:YkgJ family cysteine cluster protein [Bdellovibrionales bacterium]
MECRPKCGACCIAPSISSPLPGMPKGKPAGVPCINLDQATFSCRIWGTDEFPDVCANFKPSSENCGTNREEALVSLTLFEVQTDPNR